MKKLYTFCWILFSLLSACSNSELYTTEDFSTEVSTSFQDSLDNIIVPTEKENSPSGAATDSARVPNDSINAIIAQAASRTLIPAAGFKKTFTLSPPSTQGIVQCTFDGSEPDSTTKAFLEDRLIDTTTVVRCYEFIGGILAKKQTETYFVNEKINMPVVSISVDPYYVKEYLDAEPCKPYPCYSAKF